MRAMSVAFALGLAGCSSGSSKLPLELGNCVPPPDASCASLSSGGGSSANPASEAGPVPSSTATSGTTTCGGADLLVMSPNLYCGQCITSMCCPSDMACTTECQSLLQCTQTCMQGDTVCVGSCENNPSVQSGVTAYLDFANCITAVCPACPTLQHN
ncbi:MAG: hypothetical protein WBY94_04980 [Polyangiaceae bacterium]